MIYHKSYNYLNKDGRCPLPSKAEVSSEAISGLCVALVLDSNVCLDLVNFVTNRNMMQPEIKEKVQHLLCYVEESGIDVIPGMGLFELCSDYKLKIDKVKYLSFAKNITYALNLSIKDIMCDKYNASDLQFDQNEDCIESIEPFLPMLLTSYVALLKIRALAKNGLDKAKGYKNISEYLEWLDNELDCFIQAEIHLALAIFGGDSFVRRVLKLDVKDDIRKNTWGAAWDFHHIRMLYHSEIAPIGNIKHKPIFITNDNALFDLISTCKLKAAITESGNQIITVMSVAADFPHLKEYEQYLKDQLHDLMQKRISKYSFAQRINKDKLLNIAAKIEKELHIEPLSV